MFCIPFAILATTTLSLYSITVQDDPSLTDLSPESKAKALKVQQGLQCYEALIAHQVMQWNINSENAASTVYRLYKNWNQLLEQTKVSVSERSLAPVFTNNDNTRHPGVKNDYKVCITGAGVT